jgi:hypothetical protein
MMESECTDLSGQIAGSTSKSGSPHSDSQGCALWISRITSVQYSYLDFLGRISTDFAKFFGSIRASASAMD